MQSDSELNLTNWGMNDFQAAEVAGFVCMDGANMHLLHDAESELTLVHGAPVEIGFKITPPATCAHADRFLDMWIQESKRITLDIEFMTDDGSSIHVGTSSIQTCSTTTNEFDDRKIIFHRLNKSTLFISKVVVVQVDSLYTDQDIKLSLSTGVLAVQSKVPSVPRAGMGTEEQAIRAFLETGRYCPPRVTPRHCVVNARIVNALSIMPWSRSIGMWTHVLGVTVSNTHPYKNLWVDGTSLVLDDTLLNNNYRLCTPVISQTYDVCYLNGSMGPVEIGPSGSYTFAFELKAKFLGSSEKAIDGPEEKGRSGLDTVTPAVVTGTFSPVSAIPQIFGTPIKFKWRCTRNPKIQQLTDQEGFCSQFSDLLKAHLITSIDYLRWSACVPLPVRDLAESELLLASEDEDMYQEYNRNKVQALFIDVSGPNVVDTLTSFEATVRIINVSPDEKDVILRLDSGVNDVNLHGNKYVILLSL